MIFYFLFFLFYFFFPLYLHPLSISLSFLFTFYFFSFFLFPLFSLLSLLFPLSLFIIFQITVVYKDIAKQADAHINSNEVVLVLGHSSSVEGFLKAAAVNRFVVRGVRGGGGGSLFMYSFVCLFFLILFLISRFEVLVAEGLPSGNGRYMADRLSKVFSSSFSFSFLSFSFSFSFSFVVFLLVILLLLFSP